MLRRTHLERYRNSPGLERLVWSDLRELGDFTPGTAAYEEAYAVARETMLRTRHNVETIIAFLRSHDYVFGWQAPDGKLTEEEPWTRPHPNTVEMLEQLTRLVGPLPLSLRAWWEVVGGVPLTGNFADLLEPNGLSDEDPLVVHSLEEAQRSTR